MTSDDAADLKGAPNPQYPKNSPPLIAEPFALAGGMASFGVRGTAVVERAEGEPERKREARIQALRRAVDKMEARQARLVQGLEREDDPEGVIFRRRERLMEIEQERRAAGTAGARKGDRSTRG